MKETEKNIGFSIIQINTEQFALLPEAYQVSEPAQIQHELSFGINKENKRIYVKKTARFHHVDNNHPFIIIAVSCQFQVNPDDWEVLKEANKIVFTSEFWYSFRDASHWYIKRSIIRQNRKYHL